MEVTRLEPPKARLAVVLTGPGDVLPDKDSACRDILPFPPTLGLLSRVTGVGLTIPGAAKKRDGSGDARPERAGGVASNAGVLDREGARVCAAGTASVRLPKVDGIREALAA